MQNLQEPSRWQGVNFSRADSISALAEDNYSVNREIYCPASCSTIRKVDPPEKNKHK